jgi:sigma-E factor negative regulatory protein RseA
VNLYDIDPSNHRLSHQTTMKPEDPQGPDPSLQAQRQALSDLMDARIDPAGAALVCAQWRSSAAQRADWHAYQVIGDVLRTADLAPRGADHDDAFLKSLRARLAVEPVVMAPSLSVSQAAPRARDHAFAESAPMPSSPSERPGNPRGHQGPSAWRSAVSAAAGVMVVMGVVGLLRGGGGQDLASAPTATAPHVPAAGVTPVLVVNDQRMLRDPRLDRYLQAHQQVGDVGMGGLHPVSAWSR